MFGLAQQFRMDPRPDKIDLLVGIYKDEQLRASLMPTVATLHAHPLSQEHLADYLPIDGLATLREGIGALLFSPTLWAQERSRIYGAQTVGGTAALRVGGEFFAHHVSSRIWIPDLGWSNHPAIFERSGLEVHTYPHLSKERSIFDLPAALARLNAAPENSVVLFHASCHNPTGADPTAAEWQELSHCCHAKRLIPFFDCAYQGFGENLDADAYAPRLFLEAGHEMAVAYSLSKNFSLYRQRTGLLFLISKTASTKQRVESQIKRVARALYSNPPSHGAAIAATILNDPLLSSHWVQELSSMRARLQTMRHTLSHRLEPLLSKETFRALSQGKGMFMLLPLSIHEIHRLRETFGIYLLENGRLSLSGLIPANLERVAEALSSLLQQP